MKLGEARVLVTGGAGAIGSHVVRLLRARGAEVVVVDDLSSGRALHVLPDVRLHLCSIRSPEALALVRQVDAVVHLAARFANQNSVDFPIDDLLTNAVGTLELLEAARGYPVRFVYASSSCVSQLKTPYAVSKLTGEQYVRFYGEQHWLPVNVVRYFNSYGPHDYPGVYRSVIPNWLAQAMRQEPLVIYGDGDDTRDFTFVEDIAEATVRLVAADSFGHVIEVGTGQMTTIARLARMINALVANRAGVVFHPRRSWDTVRHRCAQVETAAAVLQYVPATSLEVGLRATYAWLRTVPMAAVRG